MTVEYIDKLAWVHIKDGKVLMARTKGLDIWYLPGGKRDDNENDIEAVTREIKEELSVDLVEDTLKLLNTYTAQAHGKPEGVTVKITCYTGNYFGEICPANEIEEAGYLSYSDREKVAPTGRFIFDDLREKGLL